MKTFKFILLTLLLMCGLIAHAQKVVVYKTDGTKVEYAASDVKNVKYKQQIVVIKTDGTSDEYEFTDIDSVAYKPKETYYFYIGNNNDCLVNSAGQNGENMVCGDPSAVINTKVVTTKLESMPDFTNKFTFSDITDYNPNEYNGSFVIMPTDWFDKMTITQWAVVGWYYTKSIILDGLEYIVTWANLDISNFQPQVAYMENTLPEMSCYFYIGNNSDCIKNSAGENADNILVKEDDPTAYINTEVVAKKVTSFPFQNNETIKDYDEELSEYNGTIIIMPKIWFENIVVGKPFGTIDFNQCVFESEIDGTPYTMAWTSAEICNHSTITFSSK